MQLNNVTVIALINGIGALQEVELPISASFILSQNCEALISAYQPYKREYDKLMAKYNGEGSEFMTKVIELQNLKMEVDIKTLPIEHFETLKTHPINMSMISLNALKNCIFRELDNGETKE